MNNNPNITNAQRPFDRSLGGTYSATTTAGIPSRLSLHLPIVPRKPNAKPTLMELQDLVPDTPVCPLTVRTNNRIEFGMQMLSRYDRRASANVVSELDSSLHFHNNDDDEGEHPSKSSTPQRKVPLTARVQERAEEMLAWIQTIRKVRNEQDTWEKVSPPTTREGQRKAVAGGQPQQRRGTFDIDPALQPHPPKMSREKTNDLRISDEERTKQILKDIMCDVKETHHNRILSIHGTAKEDLTLPRFQRATENQLQRITRLTHVVSVAREVKNRLQTLRENDELRREFSKKCEIIRKERDDRRDKSLVVGNATRIGEMAKPENVHNHRMEVLASLRTKFDEAQQRRTLNNKQLLQRFQQCSEEHNVALRLEDARSHRWGSTLVAFLGLCVMAAPLEKKRQRRMLRDFLNARNSVAAGLNVHPMIVDKMKKWLYKIRSERYNRYVNRIIAAMHFYRNRVLFIQMVKRSRVYYQSILRCQRLFRRWLDNKELRVNLWIRHFDAVLAVISPGSKVTESIRRNLVANAILNMNRSNTRLLLCMQGSSTSKNMLTSMPSITIRHLLSKDEMKILVQEGIRACRKR
eukprot:PhF_6_TR9256/c0_g1_i1/m.14660